MGVFINGQKVGVTRGAAINDTVSNEQYNALLSFYNADYVANSFRSVVVDVPNGVERIPMGFFQQATISGINFPSTLTTIGISAFYAARYLSELDIPNSVSSIGARAFGQITSLQTLKLPDACTIIPMSVAFRCTNLTSLTLPLNCVTISSSAFTDCYKLSEVTIPSSVTNIGSGAFYNCSSLTRVNVSPEYLGCIVGTSAFPSTATLYLNNEPFADVASQYLSVTSILGPVFANNSTLTTFTLPENITTLNTGAFQSCTNLSQVTATNLRSIGNSAFNSCANLQTVSLGNNLSYIGSSAFRYCTALSSIELGSNISYIGWSAFAYCSNLTDVKIVCNNMPSISSNIFFSCSNLQTVHIENVKLIPSTFFERPNNVTTFIYKNVSTISGAISNYAFCSCSKLSTVDMQDSYTSIIGTAAFSSCSNLKTLLLPSTLTQIGS